MIVSGLKSKTLSNLLIIFFSISFALVSFHSIVGPMDEYAHSYDEMATALAVMSIPQKGLPTLMPSLDSPNYDPGFEYIVYWEYAIECYMRLPFYLVSKYIDFDWQRWSSFLLKQRKTKKSADINMKRATTSARQNLYILK